MNREEIVALFMENAAKIAAQPIRVGDNDEFHDALAEALGEGDSVFCPGLTEKEKAIQIPSEKRTEDYASASVCVDEADAGIAETGSLVFSSKTGRPVQAGLLPVHHVAIVSAENIYETLEDYFSAVGNSPPTNITLETGPSRTADIELTLTIGVHGPGRLTVIVF
ncbi:MAG: lactate utilization protein [Desulfomonile tiedjei]|nr:lactate utilization protein [Desulfomonile tiedjei]